MAAAVRSDTSVRKRRETGRWGRPGLFRPCTHKERAVMDSVFERLHNFDIFHAALSDRGAERHLRCPSSLSCGSTSIRRCCSSPRPAALFGEARLMRGGPRPGAPAGLRAGEPITALSGVTPANVGLSARRRRPARWRRSWGRWGGFGARPPVVQQLAGLGLLAALRRIVLSVEGQPSSPERGILP